jgi:hypothetical protein
MARWHTNLPPEIEAAVDADLSGPVLRGYVAIATTLLASLNRKHLPDPPTAVVAALCENLGHWVVATSPRSPYVFVRPPIDHAGVTVGTLDLRHVEAGGQRPEDVPRLIWPTVQRYAARYRTAHPRAGNVVQFSGSRAHA